MASDTLLPARPARTRVTAAQRYVALAEEAMSLMGLVEDAEQRMAVCRISEAWLELAELELQR
jgi:hypothetical protein